MKKRSAILSPKYFNLNSIFWFLIALTIAVSLQQYFLADRMFWDVMRPQYNNYLIFKYSFSHLTNGLNLYILYPEEHGDLFKYSPTFALFMGLFYHLPDWLGLIIWNLLNTLCLYFGIRFLPKLGTKQKVLILLFVLLELIGNLQNEQSNAMMAGFILLTFVSFERKNVLLAALFVTLGLYLKIYGVVAAGLFIMYPDKGKFILYLGLWVILLWLLPLVVISVEQLTQQYANWAEVLLADHEARYGFSVLGVLHKWFGVDPSKLLVLVIGVVLFCLAYIRIDLFKEYGYRLLFLSSLLIWVILFNHTAEASGYILAMTGCGIWYFSFGKTRWKTILIISTFIIVSLFSTDLMSSDIRNTYIYPYYVRTIPVILIWVVILFEMMTNKERLEISISN